MTNSISSTTPVNQSYSQQSQQAHQAAKSKQPEPQDTVKLSPQAKAASGDSDHDGDSH